MGGAKPGLPRRETGLLRRFCSGGLTTEVSLRRDNAFGQPAQVLSGSPLPAMRVFRAISIIGRRHVLPTNLLMLPSVDQAQCRHLYLRVVGRY